MSEKNITVTAKTKNNTLVTIRGDEPEEFVQRVQAALAADMFSYIEGLEEAVGHAPNAIANIGAIGGTVVSETPVGGFAPVPPPASPAFPTAAAGDKTCAHGTMVKRSGESQYGLWKAWMCPTPKGTPDQCKPVYAKKGTPEFNTF